LSGLPDTAGLLMFRVNTKGALLWGHATGGYDPNLKTLTLGEYDLNRKAFPILVSDQSKSFQVAGTQQVAPDRSSLQKSCPVSYNLVMRPGGSAALPATYSVTVAPMSFGELPMSEAAARKYIEAINPEQRGVVLGVHVHLKPNPQKSTAKELAYDGTVARVTVLKDASLQQVGILYDDPSLPPAEVKVIPSAIATMKSTREFNEEVITAIYVSLAADACGWQITPEQNTNLKRYISDVSTYGKFNDRSTINGVLANIRNSINNPSVHFCESPTERQDFAPLCDGLAKRRHGRPRSPSQLAKVPNPAADRGGRTLLSVPHGLGSREARSTWAMREESHDPLDGHHTKVMSERRQFCYLD
jgi:hypothetical protein